MSNRPQNQIKLNSNPAIIYNNVDDESILINVSKARNIYLKFVENIKKSDPYSAFGLALTCLVAAATGEFHDVLLIKGSGIVLHAAFCVGAIAFTCITVLRFARRYKNKNLNEDGFIEALKNGKN